MSAEQRPHVRSLVLDATPLITQPYNHYQYYAESFYTTPTVFHEIKDERARKNLEVWQGLGNLHLVHPAKESIDRVSNFAKLTGDYSVLSANDIHILALTYELEHKLNKGDWRLRRKPGDKLKYLEEAKKQKKEEQKQAKKEEQEKQEQEKQAQEPQSKEGEGDGEKKKKRRRGGKKQKAKREQRMAEGEQEKKEEEVKEEVNDEGRTEPEVQVVKEEQEQEVESNDTLKEDYDEEDDDGDWITPDNLTEAIIRDSGEDTTGSRGVLAADEGNTSIDNPENQVALATGDFAVQNVALQMNLNLMNFMSGLRIKRLRNYMLRCHACFRMFPLPKDGRAKHFCSACGGQGTLMRCAVSVDSKTGEVTPHLKSNFQWKNRGNRYSMASPLSKNAVKRYGKKGYQHAKGDPDAPILREDQKEYEKAVKQEEWTRRHNEKVLNNWIGGGSADNYISPFAISGLKQHTVKVGRGRYVNSSKRRS